MHVRMFNDKKKKEFIHVFSSALVSKILSFNISFEQPFKLSQGRLRVNLGLFLLQFLMLATAWCATVVVCCCVWRILFNSVTYVSLSL